MEWFKRWCLKRITVNELCWYFHKKGIVLDMKFEKKSKPIYYAKNSRLYRVDKCN